MRCDTLVNKSLVVSPKGGRGNYLPHCPDDWRRPHVWWAAWPPPDVPRLPPFAALCTPTAMNTTENSRYETDMLLEILCIVLMKITWDILNLPWRWKQEILPKCWYLFSVNRRLCDFSECSTVTIWISLIITSFGQHNNFALLHIFVLESLNHWNKRRWTNEIRNVCLYF